MKERDIAHELKRLDLAVRGLLDSAVHSYKANAALLKLNKKLIERIALQDERIEKLEKRLEMMVQ